MRRHTREYPCPVCGGHDATPQGMGERCWGRTAQDDRGKVWAICTREQYAGKLEMRSTGYSHLVRGACNCEERGRDPERCRCDLCGCGVVHEGGAVAPLRPVDRREQERKAEAKRRSAERIWRESRPARGTLVEDYLRARGIALEAPDRLRFELKLLHKPTETRWPGMVALVTDVNDRPLGVHRTYLARDGSGKAPVRKGKAKMSLGPIAGGAVRLAPAAERIVVAEGIETTLAAMELSGLPGWAALSTAGMRALELPDCVRSVLIAADRDPSGTGLEAARAAARRWQREGRDVEIKLPFEPHGDFADVLKAEKGSTQRAEVTR